MSADFIDTNILFYAAGDEGFKADRADELIRAGGISSVQVLNEFSNVARKKLNLDWTIISTFLEGVASFVDIRPLTHQMHRVGLSLAERYRLSLWDALIVAAALETGCSRVFSEDMQHGFVIADQVTVTNPFI